MSIVRSLYTKNPFYLLSALCVFFGLRSLFGKTSTAGDGWTLLALLAGYATLLIVSGIVLVRWGRLWDDARSIFLIALLLALAFSAIFDEQLVDDSLNGALLLLVGLGFTIATSEAVLRWTALPLSPGYRASYYLSLAVFFLYPMLPVALGPRTFAADVAVSLFAPVIALVHLSLLPPILRGTHAIKGEAPWRFPYYPWTLPVLIFPCGVMRGYYLCLSFGSGTGADTTFAPYLVVPAVLVVAAWMYAGGWRHGRVWLKRIALMLPAVAVALCFVPPTSLAQVEFLEQVTAFFSPAQLTLAASAIFYAVIMRTGSKVAELGLAGCLMALTTVARTTVSLETIAPPQPIVIAALSVLLFARWNHGLVYRLAAGLVLIAAAAFHLAPTTGALDGTTLDGSSIGFGLYLVTQASFGWIAVVAAMSREGERLRRVAMIAIPFNALLSFTVLWNIPSTELSAATERLPAAVAIASLIVLAGAQAAWLWKHRTRQDVVLAGVTGTVYLGRAALELRTLSNEALTVVGGLGLFGIAFAISALKIMVERKRQRASEAYEVLVWEEEP